MPTYDYHCNTCDHTTSEPRKFEQRKKVGQCEACGAKAVYVISFPTLWDDADTRWIKQHECEGNGVRSSV